MHQSIHPTKFPTMYSSHSILLHQPLLIVASSLAGWFLALMWIKLLYEHFQLHRVKDIAIVTWVTYKKLLIMVQTSFSD